MTKASRAVVKQGIKTKKDAASDRERQEHICMEGVLQFDPHDRGDAKGNAGPVCQRKNKRPRDVPGKS